MFMKYNCFSKWRGTMWYIFVSIQSKACVDYTIVYCTECRHDYVLLAQHGTVYGVSNCNG